MKIALLLLLLVAGSAAAWVALRTDEPTYVPPAENTTRHELTPVALSAEPEEGEVVGVFDVTGMCCNGCPTKLYARLMDLERVRAAAVSFDEGTAQVVARAEVVEDIASLLTFGDYDAELRTVTAR